MNLNQTELNQLYDSLKARVQNIDFNYSPDDDSGGMLVPRFKNGSGIHIKKENEGKFTASAKKAGQSVQEHATSVLNNPNATPLQKKRANFARNAAKWKHQEGGFIQRLLTNASTGRDNYKNNLKAMKKHFTPAYGDGQFGGGGAGTIYEWTPPEEWIEKKDTLWIPYVQDFNTAFKDARKQGLKEFEFNGKKYTTEMGDNPNNNYAGSLRIQNAGAIPFVYKKRVKVNANQNRVR